MSRKLNGEMATVYGEMLYNGTYYGNNDFSTYEEYYNNNYEQYADMRDYKEHMYNDYLEYLDSEN